MKKWTEQIIVTDFTLYPKKIKMDIITKEWIATEPLDQVNLLMGINKKTVKRRVQTREILTRADFLYQVARKSVPDQLLVWGIGDL